jgi:hypothetical protein
MSSPHRKIALKVFLDSLPSNYPKDSLFLVIYSFLCISMDKANFYYWYYWFPIYKASWLYGNKRFDVCM